MEDKESKAERVLEGPVAGPLMKTRHGVNEAEWLSYEANLSVTSLPP